MNGKRAIKRSWAAASRASRRARQEATADAPEIEHDDECNDEIRYGGCCKHYCPTGEHAVV